MSLEKQPFSEEGYALMGAAFEVHNEIGGIELTIRNLYDGLPVRRVVPCDGLEVRRTGKFISAGRLNANQR